MSQNRQFRLKNRVKSSQSAYFTTFFYKKPLHLLKNKKHWLIFYHKNKCTDKFYVFMIKCALRNMSWSSEFRFKNSIKCFIYVNKALKREVQEGGNTQTYFIFKLNIRILIRLNIVFLSIVLFMMQKWWYNSMEIGWLLSQSGKIWEHNKL